MSGASMEGLRQVVDTKPHVVIVDLNITVMDGFGFLKGVRAVPGRADIPVLVLTGRNSLRTTRASFAARARSSIVATWPR
jgi:CheY-like chemotaxis protein